MKLLKHHLAAVAAIVAIGLTGFMAGAASAAQPTPWQLGMQPAATTVMEDIRWFNDFTLIIMAGVTVFVAILLLVVMIRFRKKANPTPSRTSHNTMIEVVWTVVPILILVMISVPSFRLLFKQLDIPEYEMTIKATGYQWYWGYEYADEGMEDVSFDALMIQDDERAGIMAEKGLTDAELPRLLATDYNIVVPVDTTVRVQVTAADVIHSFAVPAFGIKIDAVPYRLNETWFRADNTGMFYGQCSELCGKDHAFMPIAVQVVTKEQYQAWAEAAKSDIDEANTLLAKLIADEKKVAATAATDVKVASR
ncbi:cytochrome c oxidase, subunit II [Pseudovibrio sp. FO-BEG1]|uniref:Cytochrome c oxidase subunit 2 n=1 Tax=Pseudovibrio denitrificans TaxID=258256 RepID=A0A1I7C5B9_9HYPH|nr:MULTISPECIES: cytochrome c oxidase subunit II [Pseudovibrio]AEV36063.1 cytochrome c oxidase, subunit II [Pseudovibrio sp. FO-BEG1]EEA94044.1 cytochrome c oxidase, subunit II [Pseudovibrio sp. JE062]SFT94616.1 cytochrome c oxidase subunit 2 [Pseudovibrio denitrificans]